MEVLLWRIQQNSGTVELHKWNYDTTEVCMVEGRWDKERTLYHKIRIHFQYMSNLTQGQCIYSIAITTISLIFYPSNWPALQCYIIWSFTLQLQQFPLISFIWNAWEIQRDHKEQWLWLWSSISNKTSTIKPSMESRNNQNIIPNLVEH